MTVFFKAFDPSSQDDPAKEKQANVNEAEISDADPPSENTTTPTTVGFQDSQTHEDISTQGKVDGTQLHVLIT